VSGPMKEIFTVSFSFAPQPATVERTKINNTNPTIDFLAVDISISSFSKF
jgi:hypothetical protein